MQSILIDFGVPILTALLAFLASSSKSKNQLQAVKDTNKTQIEKIQAQHETEMEKMKLEFENKKQSDMQEMGLDFVKDILQEDSIKRTFIEEAKKKRK